MPREDCRLEMRVCATKGCPRLTRGTRCEQCRAEYEKKRAERFDAQRGSPTERGYGQKHREWRERVLRRDPWCKRCGLRPSTVADHIVPKSEGGAPFDLRNGQGMCEECHNAKRGEESGRARRRRGR